MSDRDDVAPARSSEATHEERAIEVFAQGEIRSYRGRVDAWLLVVYVVLAVWGVYYLVKFWGGLGPGLAR